jgi:hypothetical protein
MTSARRSLHDFLDRALALLETVKLERKLESAIRTTRDMAEHALARRHGVGDGRGRRSLPAGGLAFIVSHRSGETEDTFISDFAVAMGGGQIKTGPFRAANAWPSTIACLKSNDRWERRPFTKAHLRSLLRAADSTRNGSPIRRQDARYRSFAEHGQLRYRARPR